jgi:hypothetical protein
LLKTILFDFTRSALTNWKINLVYPEITEEKGFCPMQAVIFQLSSFSSRLKKLKNDYNP